VLKDYIQDTAEKAGVNNVTKFGARVDRVRKDGALWTVQWSTLGYADQDLVEKQESVVSNLFGNLETTFG
jgi:hypothetical protein